MDSGCFDSYNFDYTRWASVAIKGDYPVWPCPESLIDPPLHSDGILARHRRFPTTARDLRITAFRRFIVMNQKGNAGSEAVRGIIELKSRKMESSGN